MTLCKIVARRVCNGLPLVVDLEDLETDAALGLLRAIERWQPHRSSFITYSLKCIRGAIMDGLRSRDPISRWGRMLLTRLAAARKSYMEDNGWEPSVKELARVARLPLKVCRRHLGLLNIDPFVSLEGILDREIESPSDNRADQMDWVAEGDHGKYFRSVMVDDFKNWLLAQIDDPRSKRICRAYLVEGIPQREIGRIERLHESRIFQILEDCRAIWLERSEWLREERKARDGK